MDEQGRLVDLNLPLDGAEATRARLTQPAAPRDPALDAALKLPPAEALAAYEKLAAQHPDRTVYPTLVGRLHADLVSTNAEQGLWAEARAHADAALRLGHDEPQTRHWRGLACLGAGDAVGYRATCRAMVERYKSSNDPAVIKWAGWTAALAPGALDDYADLIAQLRRAAPRIGGPHKPAYRFYLGAVLLRAGEYREAAAELEQVNQHLQAAGAYLDFSPIYLGFLLAICHAHLGHEATARQWYEAAQADVSRLLTTDQGISRAARPTSWQGRLTIRLLQAEAESLLKTSAPPKTPSQ
jgi:tetratricopeptide (TPR) repeat protein